MCSHLGMTLGEYLHRVPHREHLLWVAYLEEEWNTPSRTDHYLMRIASEIRRGNVRHPGKVKEEHFQIRFKRQVKKPVSPEDVESSKRAWLGAVQGAGVQRPDGTNGAGGAGGEGGAQ